MEAFMHPARFAAIVLLLFGAIASSPVQAQSWVYQAYFEGKAADPGYITIEEKEGQSYFRMLAGKLDRCLRSEMKATVQQNDSTITVTPIFPFPGCGDVRYVIRKDGSGGVREVKTGDEWRPDGFKRGLTPRN
jgi:hypothetical protein